jgi:hypothetical protein
MYFRKIQTTRKSPSIFGLMDRFSAGTGGDGRTVFRVGTSSGRQQEQWLFFLDLR